MAKRHSKSLRSRRADAVNKPAAESSSPADNLEIARPALLSRLLEVRQQLWRLAGIAACIRDADGDGGSSDAGNAADLVSIELSELAENVLDPVNFLKSAEVTRG